MDSALAVDPAAQEPTKPAKKRYSGSFLALCRDDIAKDQLRGGPPSKLTEKTAKAIFDAIKSGVSFNAACTAAGIAGLTATRWVERGNKDLAEKRYTQYVAFVEMLKTAAAIGHKELAQSVASADDWRAQAFILERRYPNDWGKRENNAPQVNIVISDQLVTQLADALRVAQAALPTAIDITPIANKD